MSACVSSSGTNSTSTPSLSQAPRGPSQSRIQSPVSSPAVIGGPPAGILAGQPASTASSARTRQPILGIAKHRAIWGERA